MEQTGSHLFFETNGGKGTALNRANTDHALGYGDDKWTEEAVAKRERSTFLQNFYHGRLGLMISAMVQENALSQEDIQEIRKVLDAFQPREDGENI